MRARYLGVRDLQRKAMRGFVGMSRERSGPPGKKEIDPVEYVRSLRRSARIERLERYDLFAALVCAPIDAETGHQAGLWLRKYRLSHGVEVADSLIAACALANQAQLWTRNRRHSPMKELSFFD